MAFISQVYIRKYKYIHTDTVPKETLNDTGAKTSPIDDLHGY